MPQAPCRHVSAGPSSMETPLLWSIFDLSFHLRLVFFEAILNHVPASLCRATTRFHWVCAMKNEQLHDGSPLLDGNILSERKTTAANLLRHCSPRPSS
jgi:hypothetical protein